MSKLTTKLIIASRRLSRRQAIVVGGAVAVVGVAVVLLAHAAGPYVAIEPENGTVSGAATTGSDAAASGGQYVALNAPTPTPTPTPSGSPDACALPKYPNASCAGVPAGTTFTNTVNGDYTVTTNGQTIDGWHIKGGLNIEAQNVVIKNSQIDGTLDNEGPTNPPPAFINSSFTISYSTVGTTSCDSVGTPSINGHDFTASHVHLRGHQDGIDIVGNNVTASDSLIAPCMMGDFHTDGLQDQCDHAITAICAHITLTHNTFDSSMAGSNSALNLGSVADGTDIADVVVQNNLFMGGTYTTTFHWDAVGDQAKWIVNGNAWVNNAWAYDAISADGTCSHQTWSGNNAIVTIDASYNVTSTVSTTGCVE